jgi:hypothetical protein
MICTRSGLLFCLFFLCSITKNFSQQIIYVDSSAEGLNDGSSWANAFTDLQDAFDKDLLLTHIDTIRVAKGTYFPSRIPRSATTTGDDRDFSFHFPKLCVVLGGYPSGGGTRNWKINPVRLSGDIGVRDVPDDNVYHVTIFQGSNVSVDGFTISDGCASGTGVLLVNGVGLSRESGGGMVHDHSFARFSNLFLTNNLAYYAGGISNKLSKLIVRNGFFSRNIGAFKGGGILNDSTSELTATNCVFFANESEYGGAIYNSKSTSVISHSTFANNESYVNAGGGIFNDQINSCLITASVFSLNNSSIVGGELLNSDIQESPSVPGAFKTEVLYSSLQAFPGGVGCVYANDGLLANMADPDGPDDNWGTSDDGLVITTASPGFNTGDGGFDDTDITGSTRNLNAKFDMGAYEIDPCSRLTSRTVYIDSAQSNTGSGNSWGDALNSLQAGINLALANCVDTIKLAEGTYFPTTVPRGWVRPADNSLPSGFKTFHLPSNIVIIGGYSTGGMIHDPVLYSSKLKPPVSSVASRFQVAMAVQSTNIILDGIEFTKGNADGGSVTIGNQTYRKDAGGGVFVSNSQIILRNCRFYSNGASLYGGGLYAEYSTVNIDNCRFEENYAQNAVAATGGGVYLAFCAAGSSIKNSFFTRNKALYMGGGLGIHQCPANVLIDSCRFLENRTEIMGGNVVGGGAIYLGDNARVTIERSLFEKNKAYIGGAINIGSVAGAIINRSFFISDTAYLDGGAIFGSGIARWEVGNSVFYLNSARLGGAIRRTASESKIQACSFYDNHATGLGAALSSTSTQMEIIGSLFWHNRIGNDTAIANADIDGPPGYFFYNVFQSYTMNHGYHNMKDIHPLFRNSSNAIGADNIWGTADDGLQLVVQSPLVNEVPYGTFTGPNPSLSAADIMGNIRVDAGDIGAYEADFCGLSGFTDHSIYVDSSVQGGTRTGNSWQNAFATLEDALKAARTKCDIDTIKVAKGTYKPSATRGYNQYNTPDAEPKIFDIPDSITIKGGYPSGGGERSIADNPTLLLTGQIYLDHIHVELDGFFVKGISVTGSEFSFKNIRVTDAFQNGAPVELFSSTGKIVNCAFERNNAPSYAGAVMQQNSSVSYVNSVFANNTLPTIGGSAVLVMGVGDATFNNCTFFGNRSGFGGAITNNDAGARLNVYNCIFWKNKSASTHTSPFYNDIWSQGATTNYLNVSNSMFEYQPATSPAINNSIFGIYPLFVDSSSPKGPDGIFGTTDDGLALLDMSVAINKGLNSFIPSGIVSDFAGSGRICMDTVDMGAYEFDCRTGGRYTNMLVSLGTSQASVNSIAGCRSWLFYESPVSADRYIAFINGNGNAIVPSSVTVDATTNLVHFRTNGQDTTALANRMVSIVAPGSFTTNGGVRVRVYYDSTEFQNLPRRFRNWFKHPAQTKAGVLADLEINGLRNATILYPAAQGVENGITYVEFDNIASFSTFGFIASNTTVALPVNFLYFHAREIEGQLKAQLNWATSNEISNDRFEVERSTDRIQWKKIGTIRGNSTTTTESSYSLIDHSPDLPLSFYRIRQVDQDGKYRYSEIRTVDFSSQVSEDFVIGPNPASQVVFVRFKVNQMTVQYELFDMLGRKIRTGVSRNVKELRLDVQDIDEGAYYLKVNNISHGLIIKR